MKTLIVDNRESIRESISMILEDYCPVICSSSGKQAIDIVSNDRCIALVFLDINMDGIDGFETLITIKKINPSICVWMLTADDTIANREKSYNYGADGFIGKPCDVEQLIEVAKGIRSM